MDDFPEPETPVKIVICRLGTRSEMSFRLFSRAPRISMNSFIRRCISHTAFAVGQVSLRSRPLAETEGASRLLPPVPRKRGERAQSDQRATGDIALTLGEARMLLDPIARRARRHRPPRVGRRRQTHE